MVDKPTNGRTEQGLPHMTLPFGTLPFGFEQLMEINRPALSAMAEVNGKVYDNIVAINKTWVTFLNRRLKEDFAVPQQLAGCKTVQDMYGVYTEFFQNAVSDYQSEFEQISKLGKAMAEDTVHAVQARMEDVARETPANGRTTRAG